MRIASCHGPGQIFFSKPAETTPGRPVDVALASTVRGNMFRAYGTEPAETPSAGELYPWNTPLFSKGAGLITFFLLHFDLVFFICLYCFPFPLPLLCCFFCDSLLVGLDEWFTVWMNLIFDRKSFGILDWEGTFVYKVVDLSKPG